MTSEVSDSEIQSRGALRISENTYFAGNDKETNIPSYNSNISSRPPGTGPSLQSTVKVEGRKENSVDRFKVMVNTILGLI